MEENFKFGNIYLRRLSLGGEINLEVQKEDNGIFEYISKESPEAREAIKEMINHINGYESKIVKL